MNECAIGINGDFEIDGGDNHKFNSWGLQMVAALVDTSGFEDDGESTFEVGRRARAFRAGGNVKLAGSAGSGLLDVGATGEATFQIADGILCTADVVVSEVNYMSQYVNDAPFTIGGRLDGAPSAIW